MGHAPLRALKWLLISVLILLIITVVTVEVMSWNFLKPIIEDRVESATGRPLNIQGDIAVSLLPRPEFAIGKMSLANADWSAASDMLEVDRVGVRPDLSRLFRGEFALSEVNIEAPVLNLESRANKPGNWSLQGSQDSSPSETEQEPGLPIRIRELNVKDASVRYTAASAESPEMLSVPSLKLRDDRESLRLNTTLAYRDRNFELAANADSLSALMSDPETFEGKASLTSSESRAEASFAFPDLPSLDQLHADWQVTLNDVSTWAQWLRMPKVDLETIKLAATLDRDGSQWQLNNIQAIVVESRINGELSLALGGESPTLTGQLQSPEFDADAVMAALPEGPEQREIAVPALPDFEGKIAFSVGQLNFQQRHFGNVQAQMTLAQQTAAVESFSFTIAQGQVQGTASLTSDADTVGAQAQISLRDLRLAELDLALAPGDTLSGDLAAGLEPIPRSLRLTPETLLANLKTDRVELSYQNEKTGNDLDADLRLSGQPSSPELSVNGEYQHKPVTLTIEGDPLPDLITRTQEYRLKGQANSGQLTAWFNTSVASVLNPETLTADLLVDGANSRDLENWLGAELPALPGFRLAAQVNREDATWSVTGIEGNIGVTDLSGALYFQNTEHPVIRSDLNAGRIDLGQFVADMAQSDPDSSNKASPENGEASPLAVLSGFDGQLDLNASALVLPDGLEFTELVIEANLEAANMQINSLQFGVAGGAVTGNLGLDASSSPAFGHIDTEFESILLSQLGETFTPLEDRLGSLSGALHVEITETLAAARRDELLWPFIGRIHFEPSRFVFVDAEAQTDMTLNLATHGLNEDSRSFRIDGDGQYDGSPFSLQLNGDPLLDARDPNRPYAVDMEADIVDSQISLQGSVLRPFALEGLDLELALAGPNPQRLTRLLGTPLPVLPPYSVSGDLELKEDRWALTDLDGKTGDSDLAGELLLDTTVSPPKLAGDLRSDSLALADFGIIFGAGPEPEKNTESPSRADNEDSNERFVLPDRALITDAWAALSADVQYRGESVQAGNIPLTDLALNFVLEDGLGRFDPLRFGVGNGNVDLNLDLDSQSQPPGGTAQVEIQAVDLQEALRNWELADDSVGTIAAQGKFWVEGTSISDMLASSDGGLVLLMTEGRLEALLVELAGLDASQAFLSWMRGREPIPINCAYLDLQSRDGVAQMDTLVLDTEDTSFTGGGKVDFNNERLDITLYAHPKDPSIVVARTPLHLTGTFKQLEPSLHGEELAVRTTLAAALTAAAGPIAALLPLIELGTGSDVEYCEGIVSRAREAMEQEENQEQQDTDQ